MKTSLPVLCVLCAGVDGLHHNENMLEVTANVSGAKGRCSRLLEDDGHNIIANVPFPEELFAVVWGEGQQGRDMEHHFHIPVLVVNTVQPRGVR